MTVLGLCSGSAVLVPLGNMGSIREYVAGEYIPLILAWTISAVKLTQDLAANLAMALELGS